MQNNAPGSLQDKFKDFGAAPTEPLWDSIAAKLDEDKKRRAPFWWWFIGSAAFIAVIFGVYQLGYNAGVNKNEIGLDKTESTKFSDQTAKNNLPSTAEKSNTNQADILVPPVNKQETILSDKKDVVDSKKNNLSQENRTENQKHSSDISANTSNEKDNKIKGNDVVIKQHLPTENILFDNEISNPELQKLAINDFTSRHYLNEDPSLLSEHLVQIQNPVSPRKWEIGFNIGTLKGMNSSGQNLLPDPNTSLTTADNLSQENTIAGTGLQSYSNLSESHVNIRRPLQAEITFSRSLGKRWNFQTGLGVGFFLSKNVYSSGNLTNVRSRFVSIAIPVHFNYDLVQRRRFSIYSGVGVNYEVPLFETVKTEYSNTSLESVNTKKFTSGYMISLQLNTGFRYHINEKIKLDFRPNLRYYIHQSMKGTYPALERKVWAGASVGLVWSL